MPDQIASVTSGTVRLTAPLDMLYKP
jgi:hypothetical protein